MEEENKNVEELNQPEPIQTQEPVVKQTTVPVAPQLAIFMIYQD